MHYQVVKATPLPASIYIFDKLRFIFYSQNIPLFKVKSQDLGELRTAGDVFRLQ